MLNENSYSKLFNELNLIPKDEVILVYKIYFQLLRPEESSKIIEKNNKLEIWRYIHHVFIVENNGKVGTVIQEDLKKFNYNVETAFKTNKLIGDNLNKLSPTYYTRLCGTTGLFLFILKDILEWTGIIIDKKCNAKRAFELSKYGCDYYSNIINKIK